MKTWNLFCFSPTSLERQESVATTEARLRMEGVELKEEWQDEDFPGYSQMFKRQKHDSFVSRVGIYKGDTISVKSLGLSQRKKSLKISFFLEPLKKRTLVIKTPYIYISAEI